MAPPTGQDFQGRIPQKKWVVGWHDRSEAKELFLVLESLVVEYGTSVNKQVWYTLSRLRSVDLDELSPSHIRAIMAEMSNISRDTLRQRMDDFAARMLPYMERYYDGDPRMLRVVRDHSAKMRHGR